jgi:GNAT superfamily N-acetyltransferase
MLLTLRPGAPNDAEICGRICFEAFTAISREHNFPPDFPSADVAINLIAMCLSRPDVYSVVAEQDGRVVGSNFLWEGAAVSGVGPITVDPAAQNAGAGRRMMEDVLARAGWGAGAARAPHAGVRLVQAGYHGRSLALYTRLGFDPREQLACMQGERPSVRVPGRTVRSAEPSDVSACAALSRRVHGFDRSGELEGAIARRTAAVVEHDGRISGYATAIGFFGHAVGDSNDDVKALIAADQGGGISGPGVLVPTRNAELFRWSLEQGLRVVQTMTLMSVGLYQEPRGAWLPSILF